MHDHLVNTVICTNYDAYCRVLSMLHLPSGGPFQWHQDVTNNRYVFIRYFNIVLNFSFNLCCCVSLTDLFHFHCTAFWTHFIELVRTIGGMPPMRFRHTIVSSFIATPVLMDLNSQCLKGQCTHLRCGPSPCHKQRCRKTLRRAGQPQLG
jgi:hypothetical protein